ncbi:MAG: hypothetical protein FJZ96_13570, partial [Chloroflexi bacterium]|nr:hypothetical protein [Chloroflexota bacterium]
MKEKKIVLSSALIIMLLLVIGVVPSQAQQSGSSPLADQTWVRLGGPLGGMGYDIRMSPDNPDIMYVTDANAGVHKSIDGGQIWVPINDGIDLRTGTSGDIIPVFCLTIDPNDNNIVWIGLQNLAGVYRSVDGGQTWERRTHRECCRGIVETDGFTVRGIAIEPGNSEVVYIAGEIHSWRWNGRVLMGRNFDMTKGVIYKTTDGGNNWSAIWRGDNLARYILIDPGNVETIYVSTGIFDREAANSNPEAGEPGGVGILKSTDGGQTWAQMNTGLENLYVGSLFMHPTDSQTLIAGIGNQTYQRGGGVYLTHDGGQHWMRVLARENYDYITSVEYALSNPDIAYAGGEHEFAISQDGGQTWISRTVNRFWGPGGIRPGFPIDFQIDPRDPERIFVNSYGGGNFLSEDGGQTWTSASMGYTGADLTDVSIDPQNPAIVYVNGRSGPFASMDGGLNWSGINPIALGTVAEGARVTLDPDDPSHILLSSAHRGWTYESFDGGTHWVLVTDYALAFESLPP